MRKFILFCLIVLYSICLSAQIDTLWTRHYGGSNYDWSNIVMETQDNYYLMGGSTNYVSGEGDLYIVKTTSNGDTVWSRAYGGSDNDVCMDIIETSDGHYLLAGTTKSFGAGSQDIWILKCDSTGDTLWTNTFGGSNYDTGVSIIETNDNNYLFSARTSDPMGMFAGWLVKLNTDGDTLWTQAYDYDDSGSFSDVIQADSTNYIAVGFKDDTVIGNVNFWLIKVDSSGNVLWNKNYGDSDDETLDKIIRTDDNYYIAVGDMYDYSNESYDLFAMKINTDGDTLWTGQYGGPYDERCGDISPTSDGGYLIGSYAQYDSIGSRDALIIKIDSLGNEEWSKYYGGDQSDGCYSVCKTSNGFYLFAGYSYSYTNGQCDAWLIKAYETSSGITFESNLQSHYSVRQVDNKSILLQMPAKTSINIKLFDVTGRIISNNTRILNAGTQLIPIDSKPGVYFVNIESEFGELYGKFIHIN